MNDYLSLSLFVVIIFVIFIPDSWFENRKNINTPSELHARHRYAVAANIDKEYKGLHS